MRKLLLYNFTILALVIITGILGCSKDEDLSSVKIDGAEYVLNNAIVENFGWVKNGSYNFDITAYSDEIGYSTFFKALDGTGQVLSIQLFSSEENVMEKGNYSFDATNTYNAGTFNASAFYVDYNTADKTFDQQFKLTEGTFTLAKEGEKYRIKLTGKVNDKIITANLLLTVLYIE